MFKKTYTFNEFFNECKKKENKINQVKNSKQLVIKNNSIQNNQLSLKDKIKNTEIKIKQYSELKNEIGKLVNGWKEIMAQTNTYNQQYLTFTLGHIKKESYGFSCRIYVPYGLSFNELENLKPIIEDNLSCMFFYKQKKCQNFIMAKFVMEGFKNTLFQIPKQNPFEVYIGNGVDGSSILIDLRKFPHIMLSGANGSGKSRLLDCILTSLICNCNEKELELYLVQLAKDDFIIYEDAIQCKAFCDDLSKTNNMLEYIMNLMNDRMKLIKPLRKHGKGNNISDYNKLNPNKKMPVVMVMFDEYASITDTSNNSKKVKLLKQQIVGKVERIAQFGRALGVFLTVCLQRPTAQMLSPFVKSQSNLRISGKQNNQKSSEVAMDDSNAALNLDQRTFVYKTLDYDYIKTPYINDKIILENIKPSLQPNHKTIFDRPKELLKKENNISKNSNKVKQVGNGVIEVNPSKIKLPKGKEKTAVAKDKEKIIHKDTKEVQLNFDKVDPNIIQKKDEKTKINISKIPNFVPYNPNENLKVIDETKLDLTKTQKPVKKGCVILNVNENLHN